MCVLTRQTGYAEPMSVPEQLRVLVLHSDQSDGVEAGQDATVEATCSHLHMWEHKIYMGQATAGKTAHST